MQFPLSSLFGWSGALLFGVLILPVILSWLPVIFDFAMNSVLWLIWVIKYRNK